MKQKTSIQPLTSRIVATGNVLLREAGRLFRPHGLTAAQYNVLNLLFLAPGGLRQRELAAAMVVDPSSTTYAVDTLERLGYVRRGEDRADRRAWRVALTASGRQKYERVTPLYEAALAEVARKVRPADLARAEEVLACFQEEAAAAVDKALAAGPGTRVRRGGQS